MRAVAPHGPVRQSGLHHVIGKVDPARDLTQVSVGGDDHGLRYLKLSSKASIVRSSISWGLVGASTIACVLP